MLILKKSLNAFQQMLKIAMDPKQPEEFKMSAIANYLTNDAFTFVQEVSAGIETLDKISEMAKQATK